ncbi:MAG: SMC-Scp complex subunit ScpB [Candidatus Moranbacteria bacterium]|nr:SMC-Scp complex subunit ScpB [Candidatus Moranbacteria bacterium]
MEINKLKSIIESLLFVSGEPVKLSRLAKITQALKPEVENALMMLSAEYSTKKSGLILVRSGDEVQMATQPDNAQFVKQLIRGELQESLSSAALEVLSIVAYRGPITRSEIESIRGVNCTYTLRNLLLRGLVRREENPKDARGYIYQISFDFLKVLGMDDVKKLPDYERLSSDERVQSIITKE